MVGSLIAGRYLLQEQVASSIRASTYRAVDRESGEAVAVKIVDEHIASDARFIAYFHRQAHGLSELAHPNVARLFDFGQEGSAYFLVEEWVEGDTLSTYLTQRGALPVADALAIAVGVASGLAAAHGAGLLHGGLTPENITIRADGLVKVSDFGIPKREGVPVTRESAEHREVALYVSPEQAQGGSPTTASDVYALGVILYQMIAGRLPFEGATPLTIALKHVNEDPPELRSLNPSVPQAVVAVIKRAMAKSPASRYRDGAEVEQAIQGLPFYRPGLLPSVAAARTPSFLQRVTTPPVSCLAGLFVFLLIISLGGLLLALAGSAARQPGNPTVTVVSITAPSLIGHPVADAERFAQERRVHLEVTERPDNLVPRGIILEQSPLPNQDLKPGDSLRVVVSQGVPETEVPNLLGSDLEQARSALQRARLGLGTANERASGAENKGLILGQNPPPGTKAVDGSAVDVIVGAGPPPTTTPEQEVTPTVPIVVPPTQTPTVAPTLSPTPSATMAPPSPTTPPITPSPTVAPPSATPTRATPSATPSSTQTPAGAMPSVTVTPTPFGSGTPVPTP